MKQINQKIMKRILFTFLLGGILSVMLPIVSCGQNAKKVSSKTRKVMTIGHEIMEPDSIAVAQLGETAARVIFTPDKISLYSLRGYDTIPDNSVVVMPHYIREKQICYLDKDYAKILDFLLYNSKTNYTMDSIKVRSPRIPFLELEYRRKKESVSVIFSFSDYTWAVKSDGKIQFICNYSEKELINRFFEPCIMLENKMKEVGIKK